MSLIITQYDPRGGYTTTRFYQGRPGEPYEDLQGLPHMTGQLDGVLDPVHPFLPNQSEQASNSGGFLYKTTELVYQGRPQASGAVTFPCLTKQVDSLYDNAATPRTIETDYDYDVYGNLTLKTSTGFTDITGDEVQQHTTYKDADTQHWLLSRPVDVRVYNTAIQGPDNSYMVARTGYAYVQNTNLVSQKQYYSNATTVECTIDYTYEPWDGKTTGASVNGNVWTVTGPYKTSDTVVPTTKTTYDGTNHTYPTKVTNALLKDTTFEYDPVLLKETKRTDPNGAVSFTKYDSLGRVKRTVAPDRYVAGCDGNADCWSTKYEYASFGDPDLQHVSTLTLTERSPETSIWKDAYFDGLGREVKTEAQGPYGDPIVTDTHYASNGLVDKKYIPRFKSEPISTARYVGLEYDVLGRVTKKTSPDLTIITSSYFQGTTTVVDEKLHAVSRTMDAYGRLAQVVEYKGESPALSVYARTGYWYDALGNLLSVQVFNSAGSLLYKTNMEYDWLSRKTRMIDADMGTWTYELYDGRGNLGRQTDANGKKVRFTYDALNRVVSKWCENREPGDDRINVDYYYDQAGSANGVGRLTTVSDQSGVSSFSYDSAGRVAESTKTIDKVAYESRTEYDDAGRVKVVTYPHKPVENPETVEYAYDPAGNLAEVVGYARYDGYNALGQVETVTRLKDGMDDVTTTYGYYDDDNRLKSILTQGGGQTLQQLEYVYEANGNVKTIIDHRTAANTQSFTYDHLNRLATADSTSFPAPITYAYNEIGNITSNSRLGIYVYGNSDPLRQPHAVTAAGPKSFAYDANGNMVSERNLSRTIKYDADNRVSSITTGASTVEFVYDYKGQRVKKISQGGASGTIYLGGLKELDISGQTVLTHIYAGGGIIATKKSASLFNVHADHLGSLNVATLPGGQEGQRDTYYPFGETLKETGTAGLHNKFTGQEEDPEVGLYYYGARYYYPAIGRFISPDSIVQAPADPQTLNRYSYCRNNPLRYTDPTGHDFLDDLFDAFETFFSVLVGTVVTGLTWNPALGAVAGGAVSGAFSGDITQVIKGACLAGFTEGLGQIGGQVAIEPGGGMSYGGEAMKGIALGYAVNESGVKGFINYAAAYAGNEVGRYLTGMPPTDDLLHRMGSAAGSFASSLIPHDGKIADTGIDWKGEIKTDYYEDYYHMDPRVQPGVRLHEGVHVTQLEPYAKYGLLGNFAYGSHWKEWELEAYTYQLQYIKNQLTITTVHSQTWWALNEESSRIYWNMRELKSVP